MAAGHAVRVDRVRIDSDMGNAVGTSRLDGARQVDRWDRLHRTISAAVPVDFNLPRQDPAVFSHSRLDRDLRGVSRVARHELFRIGHDHADRPPYSPGQEITERQIHERTLAAESAADGGNVDED